MGAQIHGGLKAVGSIEETFRDLNDRLAILTVDILNAVTEERTAIVSATPPEGPSGNSE